MTDGDEAHALREKYKELSIENQRLKDEVEIYQKFINHIKNEADGLIVEADGLIVEFDDFCHRMGVRRNPSV